MGLPLLLGFALQPRAPRVLRIASALITGGFWLASGLIGCGLLGLWIGTDHMAAWGNENALLFNPLCLVLLAALPALVRGTATPRWLSHLALAVAICAGLALFLKFLPFRIQSTGDWIALMLPAHVVLAWRLRAK